MGLREIGCEVDFPRGVTFGLGFSCLTGLDINLLRMILLPPGGEVCRLYLERVVGVLPKIS